MRASLGFIFFFACEKFHDIVFFSMYQWWILECFVTFLVYMRVI